ncbi:PREDICTED: leucyl-cystinyl aminopeptidase-like, partial [Buceros rhinoceros silvestris]|uniref:leucyl-cystinyl aminopeptidase-like n=1 Tax=Buceros rhinoceros silvestris TaxID=175836 RepID=UPI0005295316
ITNGTLDVKKLMKTWILHKGFPLVTVVRKGKVISVQQEKFLYHMEPENWTSDARRQASRDGPGRDKQQASAGVQHGFSGAAAAKARLVRSGREGSNPLRRTVPKLVTHSGGALLKKLRAVAMASSRMGGISDSSPRKSKQAAVIELPGEVEWIKFNVDMNGYYIVHYAEDWKTLIDLLKKDHTALSSKDRANLINNIFNLACLGKESLEKAFELLDYLNKESSTAPLTQALFQLNLIYSLLEKKGEQQLAARVMRRIEHLLGDKIDQQHWTGDGTLSERELRSTLLAFACTHDIRNCRTTATEMFEKWMRSNGTMRLPSDVMKAIFIAGAKSRDGWEFLLNMYSTSVSEAEKSKMIEALASTEDFRKLIWYEGAL